MKNAEHTRSGRVRDIHCILYKRGSARTRQLNGLEIGGVVDLIWALYFSTRISIGSGHWTWLVSSVSVPLQRTLVGVEVKADVFIWV